MLKIFSTLIGENPKYVAQFSPTGKRKVVLYASAMLVPVALWFVNGFLMVHEILEGSLSEALLTGTFIAGLIFIIERCIIMSNGSKVIMRFRIFMGFIIALLGAICLDEMLFKNDIELKLAEYKSKAMEKGSEDASVDAEERILILSAEVDIKRTNWMEAQTLAAGECDGTSGSRIAKRGPICEMKMEIAKELKTDYDRALLVLTSLQLTRDSVRTQAQLTAGQAFNDKGLLIRMQALFDLIWHEPIILGVYILFTLLIFCLEFLVILIKVYSKDSPDEELEKIRNQAMKVKVATLLERTDQYRSPQELMNRMQRTQEVIKKDYSRLLQ